MKEKNHFTFLQTSLMTHLREDSWVLMSGFGFNLLMPLENLSVHLFAKEREHIGQTKPNFAEPQEERVSQIVPDVGLAGTAVSRTPPQPDRCYMIPAVGRRQDTRFKSPVVLGDGTGSMEPGKASGASGSFLRTQEVNGTTTDGHI